MSAYSLLSSMRSATGATMRDIVAGAPPLGPLVVRCGVSELSGGGGGVAGWSRTGDTNGPMWAAYPCVAGAAVGHHWHPVCRALTWHSHSSAH